jgi:hypothetical protein
MHVKTRWLVLGGLLTASSALAVKVGEPLYIRAKGTKLLASAAPTAKALAVLQPGEKVVWKGADPANKQFHKVESGGKTGVVFVANLSSTPPSTELTAQSGGAAIDAQAFASSGAATKALSEGATSYASTKKIDSLAVELISLEQLALAVKAKEINERNKKVGLFVVATDEGGAK